MAAARLSPVSDAGILDMLRSGDEQGLVLLYQRSRRAVTSYVVRNGGTVDDANDMMQDAVVTLWEQVRSGRFRYEAKLETFLVAVVKNIWLRRLARKRKESPGTLEPDGVADTTRDSLEMMMEDEQAGFIQKALHALGEPCRTLLLLYYYEELSMQDIARKMGFANADTVKSKKYQCKKALQQKLAPVEVKLP